MAAYGFHQEPPAGTERKRTRRRSCLLLEVERAAPAGKRPIEQEDAMLAEQAVRVGSRNQLKLEEHGQDVLTALRRLLFRRQRLVRGEEALHLQVAEQTEIRIVRGDVFRRSATEDDLELLPTPQFEAESAGRPRQRRQRLQAHGR